MSPNDFLPWADRCITGPYLNSKDGIRDRTPTPPPRDAQNGLLQAAAETTNLVIPPSAAGSSNLVVPDGLLGRLDLGSGSSSIQDAQSGSPGTLRLSDSGAASSEFSTSAGPLAASLSPTEYVSDLDVVGGSSSSPSSFLPQKRKPEASPSLTETPTLTGPPLLLAFEDPQPTTTLPADVGVLVQPEAHTVSRHTEVKRFIDSRTILSSSNVHPRVSSESPFGYHDTMPQPDFVLYNTSTTPPIAFLCSSRRIAESSTKEHVFVPKADEEDYQDPYRPSSRADAFDTLPSTPVKFLPDALHAALQTHYPTKTFPVFTSSEHLVETLDVLLWLGTDDAHIKRIAPALEDWARRDSGGTTRLGLVAIEKGWSQILLRVILGVLVEKMGDRNNLLTRLERDHGDDSRLFKRALVWGFDEVKDGCKAVINSSLLVVPNDHPKKKWKLQILWLGSSNALASCFFSCGPCLARRPVTIALADAHQKAAAWVVPILYSLAADLDAGLPHSATFNSWFLTKAPELLQKHSRDMCSDCAARIYVDLQVFGDALKEEMNNIQSDVALRRV